MKNLNPQLLISAILISVVLGMSACAPVYVPNSANIPLIKEKGEVKANFSVGSHGLDISAGLGVTDKIGVIGGASFNAIETPTPQDSITIDNHSHNFYEFGVGRFLKFNEKGLFEIYAGGGFGNSVNRSNFFDDNLGKMLWEYNYYKFFIQPSIGVVTRNFEAAFTMRANYVMFSEFKSGENTHASADNNLFIEPIVTTKVGGEGFKFILQLGLSFPAVQNPIPIDEDFHKPFLISMGFNVTL